MLFKVVKETNEMEQQQTKYWRSPYRCLTSACASGLRDATHLKTVYNLSLITFREKYRRLWTNKKLLRAHVLNICSYILCIRIKPSTLCV